jgi:hypothetical protein
MSEPVDFRCHVCGVECPVAPDPPDKAVCEECCEDHDYHYERCERAKVCIHCGKIKEYEPSEDDVPLWGYD